MMKRFLSLLCFLLITLAGYAQNRSRNLGINLEGFNYAYSVHYYRFYSQADSLSMAFMYEKADDPNGHTIMLLHGKNFNGAYWGQSMKALLVHGYNVFVPDQLGFGKSSKPEHYQFTFQQLAKNTKVILDSLNIGKLIVLGHSMGGMLATRFTLMYPEMVQKLVLEDPIGLVDWKVWVPYSGLQKWYQDELSKTRAGIKNYMLNSYFHGEWHARYDKLVYPLAAILQSPDYPQFAWDAALTHDMIFTQPVCYEFANLKVPTTLIIGKLDRTALGKNLVSDERAAKMSNYPKLAEETVSKIPDAKLIMLDGIGHIPHAENFDLFLNTLLPVLKN